MRSFARPLAAGVRTRLEPVYASATASGDDPPPESLSLRVPSPALLLNHMADRYGSTSRILMEFVDNSLDDAESLYEPAKGAYRRDGRALQTLGPTRSSLTGLSLTQAGGPSGRLCFAARSAAADRGQQPRHAARDAGAGGDARWGVPQAWRVLREWPVWVWHAVLPCRLLVAHGALRGGRPRASNPGGAVSERRLPSRASGADRA